MAQSKFSKKIEVGFTLIEVMVALTVLGVGLLSVAALFATAIKGTSRTEYMTQAATLASEKLEDLNHYAKGDPHIAVVTGTTAGSLTADLNATIDANGPPQAIYYWDEVFFSPTQGSVSESISQTDPTTGNLVYSTTTYLPNGTIAPVTTTTRPQLVSGSIYFKRRWVIEQDQPIAGLLRITVWVTLENQSIAPDVQFQMSIVRPYN
jgi:prepilin-type N-terminal cleavage/methylation domain-containing protein